MSSIAIITARGGSKRIPKKNIKSFCGKPIIAYSIQAALAGKMFDEVMVSTDSQEIADVAVKYGAAVPFLRSEATANDYATTADVLQEVIAEYAKRGKHFDTMCCIYPTAPCVTAESRAQAAVVFRDSAADALVPVVAFSFPPQRSMRIENGYLTYNYPEHIRTRSQDLPKWYHDVGQFYFYHIQAFNQSIKENGAIGGYILKTVPFEMDEMEVQDIDNLSDWEIAEEKYHRLQAKHRVP